MSPRQLLLAVVSSLGACGLANSACGTDAMGIDACRDIEQARCDAAVHCGLVDDAEGCRIFYRDHCLHGLATEPPPPNVVESCVSAIKNAGSCAQGDRNTALADCDPPVTSEPGALLACDIVRAPERASECSFLGEAIPLPPSGEGGTGGDPPAGSGNGGQAGG